MAGSGVSRKMMLFGLTAVAGATAGALAVYFTAVANGNHALVAGDCAPALGAVKRLAPLAHGEVAAFRAADPPAKLDRLDFKGPDGADMNLASFAGKALLLNLWATWCAPCRSEMPALDRLQTAKGGDRFQVVAVNVDLHNPERAKAFLGETGVKNLAFYSDPTSAIFANLKKNGLAFGLPTTVLIDSKGCRLGVMEGPAAWDSADAGALIDTVISDQ
jgi:thiol-disulfide isomerase/thioredoxin